MTSCEHDTALQTRSVHDPRVSGKRFALWPLWPDVHAGGARSIGPGFAAACAGLLCLACGDDGDAEGDPAPSSDSSPTERANLDVATRLLELGISGGDPAVVTALVREDCIQHGAQVMDGRDGLLAFIGASEARGSKAVQIHRKLANGDHVALHSTYGTGDNRQVAFDVFRLQNGQVAEHWAAFQAWVDPSMTVSGNSMVDGPTAVEDRALTEQNEQLVTRMVREAFVEGRSELFAGYIGDPYIQHNPQAGNGLAAVQAFFASLPMLGIELAYTASPLALADGNFVLVASEGYLGTRESYTVFYDLFRVDGSKLVEHWDVVQGIDQDTVPHDNGSF